MHGNMKFLSVFSKKDRLRDTINNYESLNMGRWSDKFIYANF